MRLPIAVCAVFLICTAPGCVFRKKQATAPPPPRPATVSPVTAQAAAPESPLSTPQTNVRLPSPQPVSPEAVAAIPVPPEPARSEPSPPPRATRRPAPAPAPAAAKPEEPPAPAAAAEERPRIQPIVPEGEQRRLNDAIEARKKEIRDRLAQAASRRRLSAQESGIVERINSFLRLSDDAAKRGDMTQADALSERALVLARELQVAR